MRQDCCARTSQAHLDLSPCANRHVHATTLLHPHAVSTLGSLSVRKETCSIQKVGCVLTPRAHLDLSPCARRPVHATTLLRSHAVSTLGSYSVRKEACSGEKIGAFSRRENTWMSLRAQRDMFDQKDCCVLTPRAHLDLSPCASKKTCSCDRLRRSHAASTLGSLSVRKKTCSCDNTAASARCQHTWISLRAQRDMFDPKSWLRSHAASTLGSLSVRKKTCSCDNTAALARCEHTWILLRAQRGMFRRKNWGILTPREHLDVAPCAKRHVRSKRLLRSYAASTLGSLSMRKQENMFMRQTAAFPRREHTWISLRAKRDMFHRKDCCDLALPPRWMIFTCGRQIQFLQSNAHTSLTLSGTRDPKPQSPRLYFTDCRPHKRICC